MMDDRVVDRLRRNIEEFEKKREDYEEEMLKIKADLHRIVDLIFEDMVQDVTPTIEQTDLFLKEGMMEFERLSNRKKDLEKLRDKLTPVIEMLKAGS